MLLSLTSETVERARMYDIAVVDPAAEAVPAPGVGQVNVGGGALPAVRVDVNPMALNHNGLSMEDVRTALAAANANRPKGSLHGPTRPGRSRPATRS
jgi:multidrug efflux pump